MKIQYLLLVILAIRTTAAFFPLRSGNSRKLANPDRVSTFKIAKVAKSKREVHDADLNFESAASGASETYPLQCSAIRKSDIVLIKGKPCKVIEKSTSKTDKHGFSEVHLVGRDIFDGKKYEDKCPSTHNMNGVTTSTANYTLVDIDDEGFVQLKNDEGLLLVDIKFPDDDTKDLKSLKRDAELSEKSVQVTVMLAMGRYKVNNSKLTT